MKIRFWVFSVLAKLRIQLGRTFRRIAAKKWPNYSIGFYRFSATLVLLLPGMSQGQTDTFLTAIPHVIPGPLDSSTGLATGDFNGDGFEDIASVKSFYFPTYSSGVPSVEICLGSGDGTFSRAASYPIDGSFGEIVVGDVDGDGFNDLVVGNQYQFDYSISILLGVGDGTFQESIRQSVGGVPNGLATCDFNGDGMDDIAWVGRYSQTGMNIMLSQGSGTFASPDVYETGDFPRKVETGDFNGDGISDLVTLNYSDSFSILLGAGDGSFSLQGSVLVGEHSFRSEMALGDFNGDGNLDVATPQAMITFGNGDGTFQAPQIASNFFSGTTIASGDFNLDGKADLTFLDSISNRAFVYIGDASGTNFNSEEYAVLGDVKIDNNVVVADFNNDYYPDLASNAIFVGGIQHAIVSVFLNNGSVLSIGDVNCDGAISLLDVEPFVAVLTSNQFDEKADINGDKVVDFLDIAPFVELLTGL